MVQPTTLRTIINELVGQNLLPAEATEQITQTLTISPEKMPTPWFINTLIGISAWLAVIPLLVFLFLIQLTNTAVSAIEVGIIFMVGTVSFRLFYKEDTLFLAQFALALNLTGQLLFMGGLWVQTDMLMAALASSVLELFLFNFYQSNIIRFTSVLIFIASLIVLLHELHFYQGIHFVILATALGSLWCWLKESHHQLSEIMVELYPPLGYGLVIALFIMLLPSGLIGVPGIPLITWSFSTVGLVMLLLGLESILLHNHNFSLASANGIILLGGTFLIGLLFYQAPGIIATIIVMVLGFQRGNRVLMGSATLFFTVFLVAYYYHLELTLLMKSITLVSSGSALLGLRWLLKQLPHRE
jgi:Domain of unknown function (DUF4401)